MPVRLPRWVAGLSFEFKQVQSVVCVLQDNLLTAAGALELEAKPCSRRASRSDYLVLLVCLPAWLRVLACG